MYNLVPSTIFSATWRLHYETYVRTFYDFSMSDYRSAVSSTTNRAAMHRTTAVWRQSRRKLQFCTVQLCPAAKCSANLRADSDTCVRSFYDVAFYHYSSTAICRKSRAAVRKTTAAWRRSTCISQIFTVQLSATFF